MKSNKFLVKLLIVYYAIINRINVKLVAKRYITTIVNKTVYDLNKLFTPHTKDNKSNVYIKSIHEFLCNGGIVKSYNNNYI